MYSNSTEHYGHVYSGTTSPSGEKRSKQKSMTRIHGCYPHGERINCQWLLSHFSVLIFLQPWGQVVGRNLIEAVELLPGSTPKQRRLSRNRSAKLLPTCGEEGRRLPALHTQKKNLREGNSLWSLPGWCMRERERERVST